MTFMQIWGTLLIVSLLVLGVVSAGFIPLLVIAGGTGVVAGVSKGLSAGKRHELR